LIHCILSELWMASPSSSTGRRDRMMKLFLHVDNDYLALISFISDFLQDRFWSPICTFAGCRHGRNRWLLIASSCDLLSCLAGRSRNYDLPLFHSIRRKAPKMQIRKGRGQGATREDIAIYVRLAHQVSSADDNFQKMSQTSPKLKRISRVFSDGGGLWKYLVRACAATKKRMHRA
ncbi:hypothetical protein OOU_Y34scaffold01190g2, partial [Pyricularia oryzae Y34]